MLRREAWAAARQSWRRLLGFLLAWGAFMVALSWLQRTDFLRGLFAGFMIGVLGFFAMVFLVSTGIAQRQMGAEAEEWTAEVLAKLPSPPWRVFHDVPLEYSNVDHVVVGPGRIYAIETKWTGSGGAERFLKPAARQADVTAAAGSAAAPTAGGPIDD
jgi:hypothetical protein